MIVFLLMLRNWTKYCDAVRFFSGFEFRVGMIGVITITYFCSTVYMVACYAQGDIRYSSPRCHWCNVVLEDDVCNLVLKDSISTFSVVMDTRRMNESLLSML